MVNEHEASTSTKVDELSEVNSFENSSCASSDISPTYDELYNNFVELHEELKKVAKICTLAEGRDSRSSEDSHSSEDLPVSTPFPRPGTTNLAQARILQYILVFHSPSEPPLAQARSSRSSKNMEVCHIPQDCLPHLKK
ncbi:hypothetical protein Lal_00034038, partial [Lupinus albus]